MENKLQKQGEQIIGMFLEPNVEIAEFINELLMLKDLEMINGYHWELQKKIMLKNRNQKLNLNLTIFNNLIMLMVV